MWTYAKPGPNASQELISYFRGNVISFNLPPSMKFGGGARFAGDTLLLSHDSGVIRYSLVGDVIPPKALTIPHSFPAPGLNIIHLKELDSVYLEYIVLILNGRIVRLISVPIGTEARRDPKGVVFVSVPNSDHYLVGLPDGSVEEIPRDFASFGSIEAAEVLNGKVTLQAANRSLYLQFEEPVGVTSIDRLVGLNYFWYFHSRSTIVILVGSSIVHELALPTSSSVRRIGQETLLIGSTNLILPDGQIQEFPNGTTIRSVYESENPPMVIVRGTDRLGNQVRFSFDLQPPDPLVTVTTRVSPEGAGVISGGGSVPRGSEVNLVATPLPGNRFVQWMGLGEDVEVGETTVVVEENITITGVFEKISVTPPERKIFEIREVSPGDDSIFAFYHEGNYLLERPHNQPPSLSGSVTLYDNAGWVYSLRKSNLEQTVTEDYEFITVIDGRAVIIPLSQIGMGDLVENVALTSRELVINLQTGEEYRYMLPGEPIAPLLNITQTPDAVKMSWHGEDGANYSIQYLNAATLEWNDLDSTTGTGSQINRWLARDQEVQLFRVGVE